MDYAADGLLKALPTAELAVVILPAEVQNFLSAFLKHCLEG
jgi:hypothetical protein